MDDYSDIASDVFDFSGDDTSEEANHFKPNLFDATFGPSMNVFPAYFTTIAAPSRLEDFMATSAVAQNFIKCPRRFDFIQSFP